MLCGFPVPLHLEADFSLGVEGASAARVLKSAW